MRELGTLDAQLTEHWPGHSASRNFHDALSASPSGYGVPGDV
jgi:hypothetical protein